MPITTLIDWLDQHQHVSANRSAVLITVSATKGSVPRGAGTRMLVTPHEQLDTIGGGHLEWKAIAIARLWLAELMQADDVVRHVELALGPGLGQCCGGVVKLMLERLDAWDNDMLAARRHRMQQEQSHHPHLYLFGAGHVGQALVKLLQTLPCRVTWVDERDHLFPDALASHIQTEATDIPESIIEQAQADSYFLVMTHHHGLDLRLSEHILRKNDVAWFGLIGSQTKRARFEHRLQEKGICHTRLQDMICPIGLAGIEGKEPGVIAVAVAAQLLQLWSDKPIPSTFTPLGEKVTTS